MSTFNINGKIISGEPFYDDITLDFGVYKNAQYYLIRVAKTRRDGSVQYPFVIAPNGSGGATQSALQYAQTGKYRMIINAGLFNNAAGQDKDPVGKTIQNGVSVTDKGTTYPTLTIDSNGNLASADGSTDTATLIANGVVSAVAGFGTIIEDYEAIPIESYAKPENWDSDSQRQVVGQFGNGDYGFLTVEGRNFDNSTSLTVGELEELCQKYNFKFAFNLDGGGSTETVIGKKQLNIVYEGTYGRVCPTYIVFSGDTNFPE